MAKKVADTNAFKQQMRGVIAELDIRRYRGYENLPSWIQESVAIDKLGAVELSTAKDTHYHLLSLQDEDGDKYYLVLEASSYLISKDWVAFYLLVIAAGLGGIFLLANWWLAKATNKVSAPLEYLSSALDQEELHE